MFLKDGVKVNGIRVELLLAIMVFDKLLSEWAGYEMTITSLVDGNHSKTSLHYSGNGMDIRTRDMLDGQAVEVVAEAKKRLGEDYDVILEADHIHVEYQPRR